MLVSTEPSLDRGNAIGMLVPRSAANRESVVVFDRTTNTARMTDNRKIQSMFLVVRDGEKNALQTNLVYRHVLSGLYPPLQNGDPYTEIAYVEVVLLFGTPKEIKAAADALEGQ